jgi:tetratricopeptide (TPR) repeat protein
MHAVIGMLERLLDIQQDDTAPQRLAKLETLLDTVELARDDFVPVIADTLSIPMGGSYRVLEGTPDRRKQRTIEMLVEFFLTLSDEKPMLFVLEDLHWVDPTTLEFLSALIEEAGAAPILMILTFRPNFTPPWPMKPGLSQLMLSHLNAEQTQRLAEHIAGKPLPSEVVEHIATRTDGVPLFVEEMTKAVLESSVLEDAGEWFQLTGPLSSLSIPNTLQDSLMARLDRLGGAREIAQLASIIGREFTYRLLVEVAPLEEDVLQGELKQLVEAELLHQRGRFPRARFTFKHALVQDTAYESLLKRARQEWHGKIADVMLEKFPESGETEPELVAWHFTEAVRPKEAVEWWLTAGVKAQEKSAYAEAISHIQSGLALIEDLDDETERAVAEFKFQIPLGVSYLSTQGYASPAVGPIFERARELGDQLDSPGEQFHILWGIWAWRVVREELDLCMKLFEDAFRMKAVLDDDGLRMEAHFIPGLTQFYTGEFKHSQHHCETGFQLYNEERCKAHGIHTGQNSGVTLQCYWGLSLWMQGHQEEALARLESAVQLARDLGDLFSLAYALHHQGWLSQHARLTDQVVACSDETLKIGTEQGFLFWIAAGTLCRGYGLYLNGDLEVAEATIQALAQAFVVAHAVAVV